MIDIDIKAYGLDETVQDLEMTLKQIDEAMDDVAKEVAIGILDDAIENVNGPDTENLLSIGQPYPVGVQTGSLKRSLKIKKVGKNKYKVFADMNIANYACWVHDGTARMKERPFLDDALNHVMDSGKYLEIANQILEEILGRR